MEKDYKLLRPYTVLSIDWDYFIDCSVVDRITKFPDAGTEEISQWLEYVWSTKYSNLKSPECDLSRIGVRKEDIGTVLRVLQKFSAFNPKVHIAISHKRLFDVVKNEFRSDTHNSLRVINIDHHHDLWEFDGVNNLTCGNWATALFSKESPQFTGDEFNKFVWIGNEDSECNTYFEEEFPIWYEKSVMENLESLLLRYSLDSVFICRSDLWSPPHLDKEFDEFIYNIMRVLKLCTYIECWERTPNRWNHRFRELCLKNQEEFNNLKGTRQPRY